MKLGYYKPVQTDTKKRDIKGIDAGLSDVQRTSHFPTTFSEAVAERGFSKMNLMTKRKCSLDSINLDALI